MKNLICSVAVGKQDKEIVVDLDKEEEDYEEGEGATDFPIAKIANSDQFTLLQLDGKIPPHRVKEVLHAANKACEQVYEVQKKALKAVIEQ
jgi:ribonuclease PH